MTINFKRGFTLIELLVVIAIIGILASVVLASLNTARDKGTDAANKSSLNNMRAQAELVYDTNGDYNDVCEDPTINNAITNAGAVCNDGSDDAGTYTFAVDLVSTAVASAYCVDNTGAAVTNPVTAAVEVVDGLCDGS